MGFLKTKKRRITMVGKIFMTVAMVGFMASAALAGPANTAVVDATGFAVLPEKAAGKAMTAAGKAGKLNRVEIPEFYFSSGYVRCIMDENGQDQNVIATQWSASFDTFLWKYDPLTYVNGKKVSKTRAQFTTEFDPTYFKGNPKNGLAQTDLIFPGPGNYTVVVKWPIAASGEYLSYQRTYEVPEFTFYSGYSCRKKTNNTVRIRFDVIALYGKTINIGDDVQVNIGGVTYNAKTKSTQYYFPGFSMVNITMSENAYERLDYRTTVEMQTGGMTSVGMDSYLYIDQNLPACE